MICPYLELHKSEERPHFPPWQHSPSPVCLRTGFPHILYCYYQGCQVHRPALNFSFSAAALQRFPLECPLDSQALMMFQQHNERQVLATTKDKTQCLNALNSLAPQNMCHLGCFFPTDSDLSWSQLLLRISKSICSHAGNHYVNQAKNYRLSYITEV